MSGYTHPDVTFAVEFYRGGWIMRAVLAGDRPAEGEALAALRCWQERNRAAFLR